MTRFAWILMVVMAVLAPPADAQRLRLKTLSRTTTFGGPGGSAYEVSCPFGSVMTGLHYREGAWVDALAPICSRYDPHAQRFIETGAQPFIGGHGGGPGAIRCALPRGVVTTLTVTQAQNSDKSVGSIYVTCGDYLNPSQHVNIRYSGKPDDDYLIGKGGIGTSHLACPAPLVAGGIQGMSGAYVDRIGMNCVDYQPR